MCCAAVSKTERCQQRLPNSTACACLSKPYCAINHMRMYRVATAAPTAVTSYITVPEQDPSASMPQNVFCQNKCTIVKALIHKYRLFCTCEPAYYITHHSSPQSVGLCPSSPAVSARGPLAKPALPNHPASNSMPHNNTVHQIVLLNLPMWPGDVYHQVTYCSLLAKSEQTELHSKPLSTLSPALLQASLAKSAPCICIYIRCAIASSSRTTKTSTAQRSVQSA